jgi:hypothetical protein
MRTHIIAAAMAVACAIVWASARDRPAAQNVQVPIFEYDPTFPKPLPETWAIGPIGGLAVDRRDHLYVVQRPGGLRTNERFSGADDTPPKADCCIPAPPVLEFDQAGTLVYSWGGTGQGYDWPQTEHGVFVDHKDVVWLAGSGAKDAQLLSSHAKGSSCSSSASPG